MAVPATTVWEVRSGGSDTNSGGFNSALAGTDRTLQNGPQVTIDNSTITATCNTTTITFTGGTYTVLAGDVGNTVNMISGTGLSASIYHIDSVGTGLNGTWVLDRTTSMSGGAVTSAKMGGSLAGIGRLGFALALTTQMTAYIKNGSFTVTSASTNVAGGCVGAVTAAIIGYDTTRTTSNTDASRPTVTISGTVSGVTFFGVGTQVYNVIMDGNSQTTSRGTTGNCVNCKFLNMTNTASSGACFYCEATGFSTVTAFPGVAQFCVAHGNSAGSFSSVAVSCVAYANTSTPFVNANNYVVGCVAYGNTGGTTDGFTSSSCVNCVSENNGRYGFNSAAPRFLINCAADANGTAAVNTTYPYTLSLLAPSGSVFVDATTQDFRLNNTAGAGALLLTTGYPSTFPSLNASALNYTDIGLLQYLVSGGTGGMIQSRVVSGF